jgi:hypothetical protein
MRLFVAAEICHVRLHCASGDAFCGCAVHVVRPHCDGCRHEAWAAALKHAQIPGHICVAPT